MTEIFLTACAEQQAIRLQAEQHGSGSKSLRLYLEGKGCDGFTYGVAFDDPSDDDVRISFGAVEVIVDPETMVFVKGSSIDWVDDERGRGFLVENPHQRKYRGKFFKRQSWQDRLTGVSSATNPP